MNTRSFQSGNTIRMMCTFRDFDQALVDPDVVKVKLYDYRYQPVSDTVLGEQHRLGVGEYFYDYPIPSGPKERVHYEWYAEKDGTVALKRDTFLINFI